MNAKKKKRTRVIIIIELLIIGICVLLSLPIFQVTQKRQVVHLELGERLNTAPVYYLDGNEKCVPLTLVNPFEVDEGKVGEYEFYLYHGLQKYTCQIIVEDTTKPRISCGVDEIRVSAGETISIEDIPFSVRDLSEVESYFSCYRIKSLYTGDNLYDSSAETYKDMEYESINGTEIAFDQSGTYEIFLHAKDEWENRSSLPIDVYVESNPVLEVPEAYYIAEGMQVSLAEYVKAWDFHDGEYLPDEVKVDTSNLNCEETGTYEVFFELTDKAGLTTNAGSIVYVCTQEEIYHKLQAGTIDVEKTPVIAKLHAYDCGYFSENNTEAILEATLPCLVRVRNQVKGSAGSGFIIEVKEDYIVIATNEHVIHGAGVVPIIFYEKVKALGTVVAADEEQDIAFVKVPVSENIEDEDAVCREEVKKLRAVHIDKPYWNALGNKEPISLCYSCIDNQSEVWQAATGTMKTKSILIHWDNDDYRVNDFPACILDMEVVKGSSGSAIFDGHGRLIAMATGRKYNSYTETYSIYIAKPLEDILVFYEAAFS